MHERLAAVLLKLKVGNDWLIPEPLRSSGTAKEICRYPEWDHVVLHAHGGDTRPQNIDPMRKEDHREKSRGDTSKAAKSKRLEADTAEFRRKLLAKIGQGMKDDEIISGKGARRKAKITSRGFDRTRSRKMDGSVVRRIENE